MMTLLLLCWNFFKTGLFAVGGGLATIPFFYEMSDRFGWFTHKEILDMIAIAESTPGPIGVNMATYAGYNTIGVGGGILATLSLAAPSVIVVLIVARILEKFRNNRFVVGGFYILRPASTALITAAAFNVCLAVFFDVEKITFDMFLQIGSLFTHVNWLPILIFAVIMVLMNLKPFKKLHPIIFIAASAVVGILLKL